MSSGSLYRPTTHTELIVNTLARWSGREAFRQDGRSWTYSETAVRISQFATLFRQRGLEPRQGVGLLSPNRPEVWMAQSAGNIAGGRVTALHPMGSLADHQHICDEADLRFLCVDPVYAAHAAELLERCASLDAVFSFGPAEAGEDLLELADSVSAPPLEAGPNAPDDTCWLSYTGGTTGVPKAVEHREAAVALAILTLTSGWDLPKRRRYLASAPISHAAGLLVLPTLMTGGTVILQRSFDPEQWLAAVASEQATLALLVPTMIYMLLDHPALDASDLASLETIMYGGAAMSPGRLAEGIERIGPVFAQFYGQAEGLIITTLSRDQHDPKDPPRLISCGMPLPGARVQVQDAEGRELPPGEIGEICVQGPCVMKGYYKQSEQTNETLAGGWLHTGDMAVRDEQGFLTIVDRKKDMIVSGGFNVFPREIEDVLTTHPSVAAVAVLGVPDEKWGEAVKAVVVPRPGETVDPEALIALVRERKGKVYAPKSIDVIESLPLTPVGKADKKVLRAKYWGEDRRGVN